MIASTPAKRWWQEPANWFGILAMIISMITLLLTSPVIINLYLGPKVRAIATAKGIDGRGVADVVVQSLGRSNATNVRLGYISHLCGSDAEREWSAVYGSSIEVIDDGRNLLIPILPPHSEISVTARYYNTGVHVGMSVEEQVCGLTTMNYPKLLYLTSDQGEGSIVINKSFKGVPQMRAIDRGYKSGAWLTAKLLIIPRESEMPGYREFLLTLSLRPAPLTGPYTWVEISKVLIGLPPELCAYADLDWMPWRQEGHDISLFAKMGEISLGGNYLLEQSIQLHNCAQLKRGSYPIRVTIEARDYDSYTGKYYDLGKGEGPLVIDAVVSVK